MIKLKRLYGIVADRWAQKYARNRVREIQTYADRLTAKEVVALLEAADMVIIRRTGRTFQGFRA